MCVCSRNERWTGAKTSDYRPLLLRNRDKRPYGPRVRSGPEGFGTDVDLMGVGRPDMKKTVMIAVVAGLSGSVLVPATASAQSTVIPPVRSVVDPCDRVEKEYRLAVGLARQAKQTAFRAAKTRFHAATSDERTQVAASSRNGAKAYRIAIADERADLQASRVAASAAFRSALEAAHAQKLAGLRSCR